MRFLLDECLSIRLADLLRDAGLEVVHVRDRDLEGQPDDVVLRAARSSDSVLVSADTNFGELLARSGQALPSVVLFRQGTRRPAHQAWTSTAHLDDIRPSLDVGAIVVFAEDRIRIRRLPVERSGQR